MPRQRRGPSHPFNDDRRGERIQKVLAAAGVASRRDCEAMVEEGRVTVNGTVLDGLPAWVDAANDKILVDGRPIKRNEPMVYVMLFKPKGIVCTNEDPEGRRRALDLVQHPLKVRVYPVGRLDMDSSGLLLLTNDGELANRLTHPRFEVHQTYEVTVSGRLDDVAVQRLSASLFVPGTDEADTGAGRSNLKLLGRDGTKTTLLMELREGRNKQIRQMLLRLGHPVRRLRRVGMGPLRLRGLAVGAWRDLTSHELRELKEAAFKPAAQRARRNERGQAKPVASDKKPALPVGKPVKPRQSTQSLDIARPRRAGRPPAARPQRGSRSR
jgi:23S rRNA pseudouridine2605 synthase